MIIAQRERTASRSRSTGASVGRRLAVLLVAMASVRSAALAQTRYQTAQEAFRVGAAFCNSRNFAASREPFEAALQMAPDDQFRLKVYEALLPAYQLLPESEKFIDACEFMITKSDRDAQRSLTRRTLLSFVQHRGKGEELAKRYEEQVRQNEKHRVALYVLSALYSTIKPDPTRAAQLLERLTKLEREQGLPVNVLQSANLARQYVQAKKYKEGAELYEQIAPVDGKLAAWHWKEAAAAWLKADEKTKALAAAKKSDETGPEGRSELLAHYWHRGLADVFLATGEAKSAIPHYEQAIAETNIQGYITECRKSLGEARSKAGP
jgi:tetratricopeptide (TPR) repeat protein